jgi:hypothetical protein
MSTGGSIPATRHPCLLAQPGRLLFWILARRLRKGGEFASVTELVDRTMAFVAEDHRTAKPFRWTDDGRPLQAA